jgi:hypothetical protein
LGVESSVDEEEVLEETVHSRCPKDERFSEEKVTIFKADNTIPSSTLKLLKKKDEKFYFFQEI